MRQTAPPSLAGYVGIILFAAALAVPVPSRAESVLENVFASIALDGRKIGQIHYVLKTAPTGEIEELRTNASMSILGIKVYNFAQHLHETWQNGALRTLRSDADDNGKDEKARVTAISDGYDAERNGDPVALPKTVFPDSIWHYKITQQSSLFSSVDLRVMHISVKQSEETVTHNGETIPAERFDFTGDWDATLWYRKNKRLIKAHRSVEGRQIVITVDKES